MDNDERAFRDFITEHPDNPLSIWCTESSSKSNLIAWADLLDLAKKLEEEFSEDQE